MTHLANFPGIISWLVILKTYTNQSSKIEIKAYFNTLEYLITVNMYG